MDINKEDLNNMRIRNPELTKENHFLCEVNHPEYGWIPFCATPDDVEEHGRIIHERIKKEFTQIPEVEYPPEEPESPSIGDVLSDIVKRLDKLEKNIK